MHFPATPAFCAMNLALCRTARM